MVAATQDLSASPPDPPTVSNDLVPPPLISRDSQAIDLSGPEFPPEEDCGAIEDSSFLDFMVCSLSRPALRMLWHQRLGHLNFRRLSTMHRFVKGMPEFTIPDALEGCPICLAAKLRKQPSGSATPMRSTVCNQGISIDSDKKRQHNLVGLNGETCYALITDHFSGRLYGRAFCHQGPSGGLA